MKQTAFLVGAGLALPSKYLRKTERGQGNTGPYQDPQIGCLEGKPSCHKLFFLLLLWAIQDHQFVIHRKDVGHRVGPRADEGVIELIVHDSL